MFRAGLCARVSTNDQQTLPMQSHAKRESVAPRRVDRYDAGSGSEFRRGPAAGSRETPGSSTRTGNRCGAGLAPGSLGPPGNPLASDATGTGASPSGFRVADRDVDGNALWGQSGSATKATVPLVDGSKSDLARSKIGRRNDVSPRQPPNLIPHVFRVPTEPARDDGFDYLTDRSARRYQEKAWRIC